MHLHWHAPEDLPTEESPDLHAATHASRVALKRVLADPDDEDAWDFLAATYAQMAPEWPEWAESQRHWYDSPVRFGLRRARSVPWAFEVGCGTGEATAALTRHTDRVVATDVNEAMITLAPRLPGVEYVANDVRALALHNASVPLLVGLNAVPHIKEFTRVISPDGQLLWCTSFGPGTPLYVEPEHLLQLFGDGWVGEAGRAGHGEWMLLSRTA
jgi:SAM-dependent methyltransferase